MIALIEGVLYECTPLIQTDSTLDIKIDAELQAYAYMGDKKVDYGVLWRSFGKSADICPVSGKISVNHHGSTTIRAIFHRNHVDTLIEISEPSASGSDDTPPA